MTKRMMIAGALVVLAIVAVVAFRVLRTPAEASEPIAAIPLELEEATNEETTDTVQPTKAPATETAAEPTAEIALEPVAAEATAEPAEPTAAPAESTGSALFEISQDASQVSFELDEDLRGSRVTVVGVTNQVAGQIAFDPADLSSVQVGTILINARTLATDNDFRNRAIQNEILDTGSYEYITFVPTSIEGLPASASVGQELSFTITGDLTIRDITHQVAFNVTATLVSETQLSGTATTAILRADYNLNIPSVPQVANVEEEVVLTIEFVANGA